MKKRDVYPGVRSSKKKMSVAITVWPLNSQYSTHTLAGRHTSQVPPQI